MPNLHKLLNILADKVFEVLSNNKFLTNPKSSESHLNLDSVWSDPCRLNFNILKRSGLIASVLIQQRWDEEPVTSLDNQFSSATSD